MTIVDGGLGAELLRRGMTFDTALWSAQAVVQAPERLVRVHRDFLAAGATVVSTATYQMSHATLRKLGYGAEDIDAVFARAVAIAREAVDAHRSATGAADAFIVAASLGPFGATLGDGSEYSGVMHLERRELYAFHAERLRAIVRARPDVVLFETIPSQREALLVAEVAHDLGVPAVWISLSCPDDTHTYAGDLVRETAAALESLAVVRTIGINCTAPDATASLVRELRRGSAKPIFACPNLGQHWAGDTHALAGGETAAAFLALVPQWLELGVSFLGGCCGVDPATISQMAALAADYASSRGRI